MYSCWCQGFSIIIEATSSEDAVNKAIYLFDRVGVKASQDNVSVWPLGKES